MRHLVFLLSLLISFFELNAQDLISVQNGEDPVFYTELQEAIDGANNGDTLFLPPTQLGNGQEVTMNKTLHLIGVGFDAQSTSIGITTIIGNFLAQDQADQSSFEGIRFMNSFWTPLGFDVFVDDLYFRNCHFSAFDVLNNAAGDSNSTGWVLENCMTSDFVFHSIQEFEIRNSLINEFTRFNGAQGIFRNSIIRLPNGNQIGENKYYENCVIFINQPEEEGFSNTYVNCLFITDVTAPFDSESSFVNCVFQTTVDGLFEEFIDSDLGNLNTGNLFHVIAGSIAENAGNDGQDIGIYGGSNPWKDGSLPFNPAVLNFTIAPSSDTDGLLELNFQVEAQDY